MDLYNGEIVAYETSRRPDFSLVVNKESRKEMQGDRRASAPFRPRLAHYRTQPYRTTLARYGMKQSMS